jgi:hypothetical protein
MLQNNRYGTLAVRNKYAWQLSFCTMLTDSVTSLITSSACVRSSHKFDTAGNAAVYDAWSIASAVYIMDITGSCTTIVYLLCTCCLLPWQLDARVNTAINTPRKQARRGYVHYCLKNSAQHIYIYRNHSVITTTRTSIGASALQCHYTPNSPPCSLCNSSLKVHPYVLLT